MLDSLVWVVYNAGFMFCCPYRARLHTPTNTQGAALGYMLLPFLAPMFYASVP